MALTRGERFDSITKVADSLVENDLPQIELALDTFGAPDLNRWEYEGGKEYVFARLRSADDDVIVELKSYFEGQGASVAVPESDGPWRDGHIRLFLTHTHSNKVLAKEVRDRLLLYGIDTFVAHEMIEVSKEWQEEIELALATCDALAALVTKDLINSAYCDQEVGFAMGRRIVVIPVRQEADPHGFFAKYHGAPGDQGPYGHWMIADGIFDALIRNSKTKDKMGPAVVRRYCTSKSFDRARENTQFLIDMHKEMWTDQMVDEVEKAGGENSQLDLGVWTPTQQRIPDFVSEHLDGLLDRTSRAPAVDPSDFEVVEPSDFEVSAAGGDDEIPF
jgi:hypothetical protein